MFKFDNQQLAERVQRHQHQPNFNQGRAVLMALIEDVVNSDAPSDEKLSKIQTALLSDMKLAQFSKKHDLETGNLLTKEDFIQYLRMALATLGRIVQTHVEDATFSKIVDEFKIDWKNAVVGEPISQQLLEVR